jgi:phage shock protein PspC (stress-responsive transcriptional regulator)
MNLDLGFKRSRRNRWVMGVCGGIAAQYGWKPWQVRLATLVLAIIIPGPSLVATLIAYFALGMLIPESDRY